MPQPSDHPASGPTTSQPPGDTNGVTLTGPAPLDLTSQVTSGAEIVGERELYPPIEPYATALLDVGDGQMMFYEQSGSPDGKPVVFLHGGPGSGGGTKRRRFFNPEAYRIICVDQRGCGESTPHVADARTPDDMAQNTTWHLVSDLELLREHLGIERWQVFGGSWGSTLALAYAEKHPDRVTELVLRGIFTLRRSELNWYYQDGASHIAPEWWEVYLEPLRRAGMLDRDDYIAAYHELLWSNDDAVALHAGQCWTRWESATANILFDAAHVDDMSEDRFALAFARIENHYFLHGGWMQEGQLIAEAGALADIPAVLVQGRYDLCCPAATAVDLHRAWPQAELRMVLAGHSAYEPHITSELVLATDRFAGLA